MKDFLQELGINIGMSVAGLFGSLVMVGKTSAYELKKTLFSILAGICAANYLTPLATDILSNLDISNYQFALAFLMGFLGLRGIEIISDKLLKRG
jgi:hypothetical protein